MKFAKLITASFLAFTLMSAFAEENTFELGFDKGRISKTVDGAVIRGERDNYRFSANPGQRISIAIASLEDNAVFGLFYRKNASWMAIEGTEEARVWYGPLPETESNYYKIEVGGTRGNAEYDLFVGVSSVDG